MWRTQILLRDADGYIRVVFPLRICQCVVGFPPSRPPLTAQLWCREVLNNFIQSPISTAIQILLVSHPFVRTQGVQNSIVRTLKRASLVEARNWRDGLGSTT